MEGNGTIGIGQENNILFMYKFFKIIVGYSNGSKVVHVCCESRVWFPITSTIIKSWRGDPHA